MDDASPPGARSPSASPPASTVDVINTHGSQVVDTWAFVDGSEWMSMEHSACISGG